MHSVFRLLVTVWVFDRQSKWRSLCDTGTGDDSETTEQRQGDGDDGRRTMELELVEGSVATAAAAALASAATKAKVKPGPLFQVWPITKAWSDVITVIANRGFLLLCHGSHSNHNEPVHGTWLLTLKYREYIYLYIRRKLPHFRNTRWMCDDVIIFYSSQVWCCKRGSCGRYKRRIIFQFMFSHDLDLIWPQEGVFYQH